MEGSDDFNTDPYLQSSSLCDSVKIQRWIRICQRDHRVLPGGGGFLGRALKEKNIYTNRGKIYSRQEKAQEGMPQVWNTGKVFREQGLDRLARKQEV